MYIQKIERMVVSRGGQAAKLDGNFAQRKRTLLLSRGIPPHTEGVKILFA